MSRPRRELRSVVAVEAVGPYALAPARARGRRPGPAGPVLHARGARPRSAAADVALPGAPRRAGVPARSRRARHARARGARAGRRDPRARPARQRLRPRRAAAAARRRWDRHRAAPVPVGGARTAAGDPRLPLRAPRRGRRARPERGGRDRPRARHRRPAGRTQRARVRTRSRCSKRSARSPPTHSSRGRRRWRAGTARVTAALSRSMAS